jgi:hypothetical protein
LLDVRTGPNQHHSEESIARYSAVQNGLQSGGFYQYQELTLDTVKDYVQAALFMEENYSQQDPMWNAPPYVLGWVADGVVDGLEPTENVDEGMSITLIVAEIDSSSEERNGELDAFTRDPWHLLRVRPGGTGAWTLNRTPGMEEEVWRILNPPRNSRSWGPYGARQFVHSSGSGSRVSVQAPASKLYDLKLDLYLVSHSEPDLDSERYHLDLSARVVGGESTPLRQSSVSIGKNGEQWIVHTEYTIEDWEGLLSSIEPDTLSFILKRPSDEHLDFQYLLVASEDYSSERANEANREGDWLTWQ